MLVALAFCPAAPVLVPELAQGASVELAPLLLECEAALQSLLDDRPDELLVVGGGTTTREHPADASGSLAGYGVDVTAGGAGARTLPLALTIGAWLLDRSGTDVRRGYLEVDAATSPAEAAGLGRDLAGRAGRVALLVMGDGTATRTAKAPRSFDERAEGYDVAIATALAQGDIGALAALDAVTAEALAVSGRAAWQVAAAAAGAALQGQPLTAQLSCHQAPYGVGYLVAGWRLPAT